MIGITTVCVSAAADLRTASERYLAKARAINAKYEAALQEGATEADLEAIRADGAALNEQTLKIFRYAQDMLIGLNDYSDTDLFHMGSQINLEMLDATIDALSDDEVDADGPDKPDLAERSGRR